MADRIFGAMAACIRAEVCGDDSRLGLLQELTADEMPQLLALSMEQDMAHLVGQCMISRGLLPAGKTGAAFRRQMMLAALRCEKQERELERIKKLFDSEQLDFLPLKGAVMRCYYPEPWQRTGSDIDILLHPQDMERAAELITERLGYTFAGRTSHDVSFMSPTQVNLELHHRLLDREDLVNSSDRPLSEVWNYAHAAENSHCYELEDAMFYYYHVAHMSKHFLIGGCGVRYFLDLWLLQRLPADSEARERMLTGGGLEKFASASLRLAELWFGKGENDAMLDGMERFVISSGLYSSVEKRALIQNVRQGGALRHYFARFWLPAEDLEKRFPALQQHRWLLPWFELRRLFSLLTKGGFNRLTREVSSSALLSAEERESAAHLLDELGFK